MILVKRLAEKYDVSELFVEVVLDKIYDEWRSLSELSIEDFFHKNPGSRGYVDYSLSAAWKGSICVERIKKRTSRRSGRALDIGCGTGGVALALSRSGFDVVGIEIDPALAAIAKVATQGRARVDIRVDDILNIDVQKLGKFDVICCNAVIEHVSNPQKLLQQVASLLTDGGVLHLEVPNKDCIRTIRSDLHYGLFGIQLLSHGSARSYHAIMRPGETYSVGEFFERSWYGNLLRALGFEIEVEVADWGGRHQSVIRDLADLWVAFCDWEISPAGDDHYLLRTEIKRKFLEYFSRVASDLSDAEDTGVSDFEMKYCAEAWTFVGTKLRNGVDT